MTDYTSEIDAWYQAIQYRNPPASELASFNAQLQAGIITTAQAVTQIEASTYTQSYVDPVIREYQAAFGRVPDQAGVAYWVGQVATNPANLALLSTAFANSAEFFADYAASATTPASSTLVTALYQQRPRPRAGRRRPRLLVQFRPRRRAAAAVFRAIAGIHHRHHPLRHPIPERGSRRRRADQRLDL